MTATTPAVKRLKLVSISMRNFQSYGNNVTVVKLDQPGTTFIVGQDLDNTTNGTGSNGVGKSLSVNSLIKIPNGWKRMGDIQIGDIVQAYDGTSVPVVGVYPQGTLLTYKVTFSDGRSVDASADHLWQVQSHRWTKDGKSNASRVLNTLQVKQFVDEANQKKKAWYNVCVPTVTHPTLPEAELPIDPYLLGCLLGDGAISGRTPVLTSADREIVDRCNHILISNHDQILHQLGDGKYNNGYDWHCINNSSYRKRNTSSVKSALQTMGLYGTTSINKFIPKMYLEEANEAQKLQLLAGLLDTDGTVGKTKNISYCSISEQLAKDVQYLIRSLGGKASISTRTPCYRRDGEKVQGRLAYNVSIQYKEPRRLFTLPRKLERLSEGRSQYADAGLRIVSIEPHIEQECQCISINHPDKLYITDDFIVTHNTTILNAIVYALYNRALADDVTVDGLINNINKKNMEVTLDFTIGDMCYRIVRARKMKSGPSGNYVMFYARQGDFEFTEKDDLSKGHSVYNTDADIEAVVGMKFDMFTRIVVFSAMKEPFFNLPLRSHGTSKKANQTDFIEELFGLTELSDKAEQLKAQTKEVTKRLEQVQIEVQYQEKEHARYAEQLAAAQRRVEQWDRSNAADIQEIESTLQEYNGFDFDAEWQLINEEKDLRAELDVLEAKELSLEKLLKAASKAKRTNTEELAVLADAKCPYCSQEFKDNEHKVKDCSEKLAHAESEIETITAEWTEVGEQIAKLLEQVADVQAKRKLKVKGSELTAIQRKVELGQSQLEQLRNAVNPFVEPLEELKRTEIPPVNYTEINALTKKLEHHDFLYKLLTKKDSFVRRNLLNKNLPYLNQKLQEYLTELGLAHKVEFTHELTARITQFGRELGFGNLSAGQKARVNIALSFAFRDVLQSMHTPVNVCMLDEILDVGLNGGGVQMAVRMLKRKARDEKLSMYVISHRDEIDSSFDRTLTVQMSKGFSYIFMDDGSQPLTND